MNANTSQNDPSTTKDANAFTFRMGVDGYGTATLTGSKAFAEDAGAAISVLTMAFLAEHVRHETAKGRSLGEIHREFTSQFDAQVADAMKQVDEHPDKQARVTVRAGDTPSRPDAAEELSTLRAENEKLAAFKTYVHHRLDVAGVPTDPESPHKAEGCRIGGRLDLVLAQYRPDAAAVNAELVEAARDAERFLADAREQLAGTAIMDRAMEVRHRLLRALSRAAP